MDSDDGELLVILSSDAARVAIDELAGVHPILQAASWRVLVIGDSGDAGWGGVAAIPGVTAVSGADVALEILDGLDESEVLFVRAWSMRKGSSKERRRGEGLDWDAEGFEPPDPPPEVLQDGG